MGSPDPNPSRIYVEAPRPSYDDGPRPSYGDEPFYDDALPYELDDAEPAGGFPGEPPPPRGSGGRGGGGRRKRNILWRMRRLLFVAGLTVMALIAAGVAVIASSELPDPTVLVQSSLICDASVPKDCNAQNAFAQLSKAGDRENVKLSKVPPLLVQAIIDSEDAGFREHKGLNPVAISRALYWDIRSGTAVQGGSTITQQYVKNRFLTSEQTVTRKLKEAVLAVKLEQSMSKDEILEGYLNTIFFGRNAYGIQAAARAYFGKDVSQITELRQVAYLAGLIRAPNRADAATNPEAAKDRRTKVLDSMLEVGTITKKQYDENIDLPFDYVLPADSTKRTLKLADKGGVYLTEYVEAAIKNHPDNYNLTETDVNLGGLRIYTTIDPNLQTMAYNSIYDPATNAQALNRDDLPVGALVSIDNEGNVKAMVGGRGDGTGTNFAVEGHGSNGRQTGSTFKPIVLATAIKAGVSLESMVPAPKRAVIPQIPECDAWPVRNAGESEYANERIDLVTATKESVNTAYGELIYQLAHENGDKTDNVVAMAKSLGMNTEDVNKCLPMVLGSNNSSPMEMAEIYSTFANRGEHKEPRVISRIERVDKNGETKLVYQANPPPERVLSEKQADLITSTLEQVIADGTGKRAQIDKPAAGKTGTTGDNKDAWFVGYTPKLTTAVWMGFEKADWINPECPEDTTSGKTAEELQEEGSMYYKLVGHPEQCPKELGKMGTKGGGKPVYDWESITGGSLPAIIWSTYMRAATEGHNDTFNEPTVEALRDGRLLDTGEYNTGTTVAPTTTSIPQDQPPGSQPDVTISIPDDTTTTTIFDDTSTTTTTDNDGGPGGGGGGGRP